MMRVEGPPLLLSPVKKIRQALYFTMTLLVYGTLLIMAVINHVKSRVTEATSVPLLKFLFFVSPQMLVCANSLRVSVGELNAAVFALYSTRKDRNVE